MVSKNGFQKKYVITRFGIKLKDLCADLVLSEFIRKCTSL